MQRGRLNAPPLPPLPTYTLCNIIIDDNDNLISLRLPHYQVYVRGITSPACKNKGGFSLEKQVKVKNEESNSPNYIRLELFWTKKAADFLQTRIISFILDCLQASNFKNGNPPAPPSPCRV